MRKHTFYSAGGWLFFIVFVLLSSTIFMSVYGIIKYTISWGVTYQAYALYLVSFFLSIVGIIFLFLGISFKSLRYTLTREFLFIKNGLLTYQIPLDTLDINRTEKENNLKTTVSFWSRNPFARHGLILENNKHIFIITPNNIKHFRSLFFRLLKIQEREKALSIPRDERVVYKVTHPFASLSEFSTDPVLKFLAPLNLILVFVFGVYTIYVTTILPKQTVLAYSFRDGIRMQGSASTLFFVLLLLTITYTLFLTMSIYLFKKERFSSYLIMGSFPYIVASFVIYYISLIIFEG